MTPAAINLLGGALAILSAENAHTWRGPALDHQGQRVFPDSEEAISWNLAGALQLAGWRSEMDLTPRALSEARREALAVLQPYLPSKPRNPAAALASVHSGYTFTRISAAQAAADVERYDSPQELRRRIDKALAGAFHAGEPDEAKAKLIAA